RRDDFRVVEHEDVARFEQGRQVTHRAILQGALCLDDEELRRVARAGWPQGDAVFRQVEIEEVDAHQVRRMSNAPATTSRARAIRPIGISARALTRKPMRSRSRQARSWPDTGNAMTAAAPRRGPRMMVIVT